jgi:D-serine deaminase-like pyridoxal phosphate-dependent protein
VAALQAAGLPPAVVTGSGTGSVGVDLASGVYTEVQPGSYAFMDRDYADNEADDPAGDERDTAAPDALRFEHALFLASTVISVARPGQLVLDCGLKTLSAESGPPLPWPPRAGWGPVRLNDEHGVVALDAGTAPPVLGERVLLVPGHCDPTFNLHDHLVVLRDGRVADLWPIAARGHSW